MKPLLTLLLAVITLPMMAASAPESTSGQAKPEPAVDKTEAFPEGSPKFGTDYAAALKKAKAENKPAILIFSAAWCAPCQVMKKKVYPSAKVKPLQDKFVWAYLDADMEANAALMAKYGINVIPHIQFVSPSGENLGSQLGLVSADEFAGTLETVLLKAGKKE